MALGSVLPFAISQLCPFLMPLVPGFYEPIRKATNQLVGANATDQIPITSIFAGAASGVVGGNPSTHYIIYWN